MSLEDRVRLLEKKMNMVIEGLIGIMDMQIRRDQREIKKVEEEMKLAARLDLMIKKKRREEEKNE